MTPKNYRVISTPSGFEIREQTRRPEAVDSQSGETVGRCSGPPAQSSAASATSSTATGGASDTKPAR